MERVEKIIQDWGISVHDTLETHSSFLAFGARASQLVVLKVVRQPGDEWHSGEVLNAFDGQGMVRVCQYVDGAVLLERLNPGTALAAMALEGRDQEATAIIADVIKRLSPSSKSLPGFATVEDWGKGFQRYLICADQQVPRGLVEQAEQLYAQLCATQQRVRLLHGDLQHYNILFDSERGWIAIDPKGVVGEIEYEIGASLRNPGEEVERFASSQIVEQRLKIYENRLHINFSRALAWGFSQAVLSAVWTVEDGFAVAERNPAILLARAIEPMLD
jgi:streptomycin 6-kinase